MKKVLIIIVIGVVLFLGLSSGEISCPVEWTCWRRVARRRVSRILWRLAWRPLLPRLVRVRPAVGVFLGVPYYTPIYPYSPPYPPYPNAMPRLRCIANRRRLLTGTTAGIPRLLPVRRKLPGRMDGGSSDAATALPSTATCSGSVSKTGSQGRSPPNLLRSQQIRYQT